MILVLENKLMGMLLPFLQFCPLASGEGLILFYFKCMVGGLSSIWRSFMTILIS